MRETIKNEVAVLKSCNMPNQVIANTLEISRATVQRILKDNDIKEIIENCKQVLISKAYNKSIDNIVHCIDKYQDKEILDSKGKLTGQDYQLKEHGFKASIEIARAMGLLPSHSLAQQVTNIMNIQANQYITPLVSKALQLTLDNEAIDIPIYTKPVTTLTLDENSNSS